MKIGVIFAHGNLFNIHPEIWSKKCIDSIRNQTVKDLNIYEINFGDDRNQLVEESTFFAIEKMNFADATNHVITEAFNDGCDYVFNTNIDDIYDPTRIEKQLVYLQQGYDIVSSDFCYIDEDDKVFHHMKIKSNGDIKMNLDKDHNVIANPCVVFSKNFWDNPLNRYDINSIGREDLDLWKDSIARGYKFYIHDEELLLYRIHNNKASADPRVGLNRNNED